MGFKPRIDCGPGRLGVLWRKNSGVWDIESARCLKNSIASRRKARVLAKKCMPSRLRPISAWTPTGLVLRAGSRDWQGRPPLGASCGLERQNRVPFSGALAADELHALGAERLRGLVHPLMSLCALRSFAPGNSIALKETQKPAVAREIARDLGARHSHFQKARSLLSSWEGCLAVADCSVCDRRKSRHAEDVACDARKNVPSVTNLGNYAKARPVELSADRLCVAMLQVSAAHERS